MDLVETPADSAVQVVCPHCGRVDVDEFELLTLDEIHALTCDVCACRFHLALFECAHCGEETISAWATVPTPTQIQALSCRTCGHRLHDDEQDVRTMGRA